jgi:hypothetical protein
MDFYTASEIVKNRSLEGSTLSQDNNRPYTARVYTLYSFRLMMTS